MVNESVFKTYKDTVICLLMILGIVIFVGMTGLIMVNYNYFSQFGDDNAQYFPFMTDFLIRFKANKLSFYSFSNYLGSSYFVETYYVSFDIFSLITLIFSYFMPYSFAFGFQEYAKLFLGVLAFSYYLHLRGRNNKSIFYASLIYMICGSNVINSAFPIYYSLIFYFPLVAICMEYFNKGKKYILPLLMCVLVFYNYYNAYLCIIFAGILLLLHYAIDYHKYKRNLFKHIFEFAALGILGVLMASVVLVPSAFAILNDTTKGDFSNIDFKNLLVFKDGIQYLRIIGELFTPAISTDYWGFSNNGWYSYINMHLSLYITVIGLVIALSVYFLDDRESNIYKVIFPLEIVILTMPIFYMILSGSTSTYTRWYIALSFLNILIVANVIDKTDFDFYKNRYKHLILNSVILIICLITLNLYTNKVFETNLFNWIKSFGLLPVKLNINPGFTLNFQIDCYLLLAAAVLIIIGTISCFKRGVKITPYLLTVELVVGVVFMYMSPYRALNFIYVEEQKDKINTYLNTYTKSNNDFYRVYIHPLIDKGGDGQNFNRTQLTLTSMKNFHSWHTAVSHELTHLIFGSAIDNNNSAAWEAAYLDIHQLFGTKYIAAPNNGDLGLPSGYVELEETKTKDFVLYENLNYTPFVAYDIALDLSYTENKTTNVKDYSIPGERLEKIATLLNYVYYTGEEVSLEKSTDKKTYLDYYFKRYTTGDDNAPWDFVSNNYYAYQLDTLSDYNIPNSGMLSYYVDSQFSTKFGNVFIGYREDGTDKVFKSCFGPTGVCYYEDLPKDKDLYLYIQATTELNNRRKGEDANMDLSVKYYDTTYLDEFYKKQAEYKNKKVTYNDSGLNISFDWDDDKDIIISIPVAYLDGFNAGEYKVINVNGGLTGIYIPKGSGKNINISLKYTPKGLKPSALVSMGAFLIYGGYITYELKFKKKEKEID